MSLAYDKSRVRVLVVDDEDSIRMMLTETLKDDGWDVDSAKNGKDAVEKIKVRLPHLIISDINMPEMTGTELLEYVKSTAPQVEFVIMTSHATLETALKAVKLGAYDYLHKPFDDISIVPSKLSQVAERIFLRQQNHELLKRLQLAGSELKRLIEAIRPLGGLLSMEELRTKSAENLPLLFEKSDLKFQWWACEDSKWICKAWNAFEAEPSELEDVEQAKNQFGEQVVTEARFLKKDDQVTDYLIFENPKPSLSNVFLQQVELCYEKIQHHLEIASLANKDGLTKLYNHRYFQERLMQEVSISRRQHSSVSVLLMDVDHFKNYNDQNGHPAGDRLLKKLASLLNRQGELGVRVVEDQANEAGGEASNEPSMRRVSDVVARYGGEEFIMILPFTPFEGAKIKAERVLEAIRNEEFEFAEKQPLGIVSVSMGVATFPEHGSNPAELVEAADRALYRAKKSGRNQFVGADFEVKEELSATAPPPPEPEGLAIISDDVTSEIVSAEPEDLPPPPQPDVIVSIEEPPPPPVLVVENDLPPPPPVAMEIDLPPPPMQDELPPPPPVEDSVPPPPPPSSPEPDSEEESPLNLDALVSEAVREVEESQSEPETPATLADILDGEDSSNPEMADIEVKAASKPKQEVRLNDNDLVDIDSLVNAISAACDSSNDNNSKDNQENLQVELFQEETADSAKPNLESQEVSHDKGSN